MVDETRKRSEPSPTRAAHGDRTDARHNLPFGQMHVPQPPPAPIVG
jgi:hypothetical protein